MSEGRAFQARGPAMKKALSVNMKPIVREMTKLPLNNNLQRPLTIKKSTLLSAHVASKSSQFAMCFDYSL